MKLIFSAYPPVQNFPRHYLENLSQYFIKVSKQRNRSTRFVFSISLTRISKLQQSLIYQGVKMWNSIPSNINNETLVQS